MNATGLFCGIGVGPGEPGLIPLIAWDFLLRCDVIFAPRAASAAHSVARMCLPPNEIPENRFREIELPMDSDREALGQRYDGLARTIAEELLQGKNAAYLTIGDPSTYSTYNYTLAALERRLPGVRHRTFPGVTSYCAVAAAAGFPLGEGKERVLILPCPDEPQELRAAIESHDIVVLMKIGRRLSAVLDVLHGMGIAANCALGCHAGMSSEVLHRSVLGLKPQDSTAGYLATMLIRKQAPEHRSGGAP